MSKLFIGVGHGGSDVGASANGFTETSMNLKVALELDRILKAHNIQTKMSRYTEENDPLSEEIRECNDYNPDMAIDVHFNAGGGDGFEFFYSIDQQYTQGKDKRLGELIEKEVIAIGQNSRGGKTKKDETTGRDYFGFIRELKCPSIIVEGCFIDNTTDLSLFDTDQELKALSLAYAKGILSYYGIAYNGGSSQQPQPQQKEYVYLPKEDDSWRVYSMDVAPVTGNECGFLNPKKFDGLEYEVLGYTQKDVAIIQTRDFGKVQIYVAPSTGAKITKR